MLEPVALRASTTIPWVLVEAAKAFGGSVALVEGDETVTYRELRDLVARTAGGLDLTPRSTVAACLPNGIGIVVAFLATMWAGARWMGVNQALALAERRRLLDHAGADIYLTADRVVPEAGDDVRVVTVDEARGLAATTPAVRPPADLDPHGVAAIAYTSGTTGAPKAVAHSQHNLLTVALAGAEFVGGADRHGVALPLTVLNLAVLGPLQTLLVGGVTVCLPTLRARQLADDIARHHVERLALVPTVAHDLLTDPAIADERLHSLGDLGIGGASWTQELLDAYLRRFGRPIRTSYGLTEAPAVVAQQGRDEVLKPGSAGRAMPHVEIVIVDGQRRELPVGITGEICVQARTDGGRWDGVYTPMLGYLGDEEQTRAAVVDGRLHTGDMGRLDADGQLFVADRRSNLIVRGGANVYPAEVEQVLAAHPAVAEAVVLGRPHERLGEEVVAVVRPTSPQTVDGEELRAMCRERLARYKVPSEIRLIEDLPRNAMGKVSRSEVAAACL